MISEFKEQFAFLSNFYHCEFVWNGFTWHSSECAYQAAKSINYNDWCAIAKMSAGQSKRAGKKVKLRADWEQIKFHLMHEIVREKFLQNDHLKMLLIATGERLLEEGNSWGDRVWGISPANSGNGKNELGKILMAIRKELNGSL